MQVCDGEDIAYEGGEMACKCRQYYTDNKERLRKTGAWGEDEEYTNVESGAPRELFGETCRTPDKPSSSQSSSPSITKQTKHEDNGSTTTPHVDFSISTVLQIVQSRMESGTLVLAPGVQFDDDFHLRSKRDDAAGEAGWWKDWGGRGNARWKSQDALAHHSGKSKSAPACTVEVPVYTQGKLAPFPSFSSLGKGGQEVSLKFRLMGSVFHPASDQALSCGSVLCVEAAAFNKQDQYYALVGFLRKTEGGPSILPGNLVVLGKVHSALLGVHSTAA